MMQVFVDGFPVGKKFVSQARTIGEGDFTLLHNLTWNTERFQADAEHMKSTQFGERILAGPCVLAVATGLMVSNGDYREMLFHPPFQELGFLGMDEWRMKAPVKVGDTLAVTAEIIEVRPTSKPDRAVLRIRFEVFNQRQEIVMHFLAAFLEGIRGK